MRVLRGADVEVKLLECNATNLIACIILGKYHGSSFCASEAISPIGDAEDKVVLKS